jgi:isochorismate synthase
MEIDQELRASTDPVRLATVEVDLDPLDLVRAGREAFGWAGFYSAPDGKAIGGLGKALVVAGGGSERFSALDSGISDLPLDTHLLTGFSFDDAGPGGVDWEGFSSGIAVLPEVAVIRAAGRSRMVVAVRPGSDGRLLLGLLSSLRAPERVAEGREVDHNVESRPTPSDWRDLVAEAVASIGAGAFEKVVLARTVLVRTPGRFEGFDLVAQLRDRYSECRIFGWQEGDAVFVGASPELLVAREGERFRLNPLAGSVARGVDPEEDRWLGDALLASEKDRHEHAVVVVDAVERLSPLATAVDHPPEPVLQRHATVQHLATPISGRSGHRLLELAAALHPTAAVGGSPRQAALDFIAKQEGIDRGWYSGGIGWMDPSGDGELAVALRCALVRGDHAIVYAGNGIVARSRPEQELAETRLKLHPMLDLLTGR